MTNFLPRLSPNDKKEIIAAILTISGESPDLVVNRYKEILKQIDALGSGLTLDDHKAASQVKRQMRDL